MGELRLGVLSRSRKENEHRLPIHPLHVQRLDAEVRGRVFLQEGYGEQFGVPDEGLAPHVGGLHSRAELLADCDVILLPKPRAEDVRELPTGTVLWGWPHCVQDEQVTQLSIDQRLTVIAFEAMNRWSADGSFAIHVFHKNNELAGFASVLHALQLIGSTGSYGRRLRAAVIGFGATGRGAVAALNAQGVRDTHVLTQREVTAVASPMENMVLIQLRADADQAEALTEEGPVPLTGFLAEHDVVVNCVLQDPEAPLMFIRDEDLGAFQPGSLIIDVSCDEGMGFSWAKPTSFTEPMFSVGDNVHYYAVDHSPSYLWNSATWEISEALLPYLPTVLGGPDAWAADETIRRAIEIRDGVIQNKQILSFQGRSPYYPHPHL